MVLKENPLDFDIYPVTCEKLSNGRSNLEVLDGLIKGGARVVQLREKDLSDRDLFALAKEFRRRTEKARMTLIINDRMDICRAVKADGLHLGQDDFPVREARNLMGPDTIIGVSTHSLPEALKAVQDGADYINVGPVFSTKTKEHVGPPVGLELFRAVSMNVRIPITVMGGIDLTNIDEVVQAGARRVAVVTAITQAKDIAKTVAEFRKRISQL